MSFCLSSQVEALVLCADATLQRVLAMHAAPWFRAYSLLQRCCPRLDLATYVERCASIADANQQLVRNISAQQSPIASRPEWVRTCAGAQDFRQALDCV